MKPYIQETLSDDKGSVVSAQRIPPKSEGGGGGGNPNAVLYTAQTLSAAQQAQARTNIGAGEPVTDEQLADAAAAWLEDNITNPSNPPIDKSLAVSNAAADSATVGGILYGEAAPVALSVSPWTLSAIITGSGVYNEGALYKYGAVSDAYYYVFPLSEIYQAGPGKDANNVLLTTWIHEYDANGTWLRRTGIATTVTQMRVGADCAKVRFAFARPSSTGVTMTQTDIDNYFAVTISQGYGRGAGGFGGRINMLESNVMGLHSVPPTNGVLNLVKRIRQLTDIKWTPAVDLPRYMMPPATPPYSSGYTSGLNTPYIGTFKAGVEYTGIPYGRCSNYIPDYGLSNTFVGLTIDFGTFITAVRNAESLISKESEGSTLYHHSVPYAAVCSALVSYALGVPYTTSDDIPSLTGMSYVAKVVNSGVRYPTKNIKVGDVLIYPTVHVAIVSDIATDENGTVTAIEVAEATTVGEANPSIVGGQFGGLCRRIFRTIDDFYAGWGDYSIYRYARIDAITYTPSPYVPVGNDPHLLDYLDLPCMPYQGNGFKFKAGYIPNTKILVNATDYGYLRVFKDGSEITGSPFAVAEGAEYVEVGFSEAGNYEAYLCNMSGGSNTEVTAKCKWTVES